MQPAIRSIIVTVCCVVAASAWLALAGSDQDEGEHAHEHVELAPFMTQLQWHSQKLGYAIEGHNAPLAEFYLHEVTEVLEEIKEQVPVHDKLPIADLIGKIPQPTLAPLDRQIEASNWTGASKAYAKLIDACNRCHAATQHQFIVITPARGRPPFNQVFEPQQSQRPTDSN